MRVVLLSSTLFGYRCLKKSALQTPGVMVTGILTTPREINISYSEKPVVISTYKSFYELATQTGCEVVEISGKMTESAYLEHLDMWQPDLLLVLGWYYVIPRKVRESVPLGCVGIHASLLPKYRGGAPIPWAIIKGETKTGITLFYLDDRLDCGDIISQTSFPIEDSDTCGTVYEKATQASIKVLREYLPLIATDTAPRTPQDESQSTSFPQRNPEDGLIDWSWSAKHIYDFIRAQTRPYPGAFTFCSGDKLIVWNAKLIEKWKDGFSGEVLGTYQDIDQSGFVINLHDGALLVTEVGIPNEGDYNGLDYARIHQLEAGGIVLGQ